MLLNPVDPARPRGEDLAELQRLAARHLLDASRGMLAATALLGPLLERSVARPERMPPALVGRYAAPFVGQDGVRHLMALAHAINDRALDGVAWERISAPTLVLRGEADRWVEPALSASLATRLTRAEYRHLPDAARLIPEDLPEVLARTLRDWLTPDRGKGEP